MSVDSPSVIPPHSTNAPSLLDRLLGTSVKTAGIIAFFVAAAAGIIYTTGYELSHRSPTPAVGPADNPPEQPPVVPVAPVQPPVAPVPPLIEPVKLEIFSPQPHILMTEVSTIFVADVIGGGDPEWHTIPPASASISPTRGKRVNVTAHVDGKFSILVSVAGDNRQLATAQVEMEALAQVVQQPVPIAPPVSPDMPPSAPVQPIAPQPLPNAVTANAILGGLNSVTSPDRKAEMIEVANTLTAIIGRINAQFIPPSVGIGVRNIVTDEVTAKLQKIGHNAQSWSQFISTVSLLFDRANNMGQINSSQSCIPILNEVIGVLLNAQ